MSEQRDTTDNAKLSPEADMLREQERMFRRQENEIVRELNHDAKLIIDQLKAHISALERERDEAIAEMEHLIFSGDIQAAVADYNDEKAKREAAEASLAKHIEDSNTELDVLNAANHAYREEVDSLKASLAQAQKERDEARSQVLVAEHASKISREAAKIFNEETKQARREGMLAAATSLANDLRGGLRTAEVMPAIDKSFSKGLQDGLKAGIEFIEKYATAIRRAAEEK